MPEGDSIHRLASRLGKAVTGKVVRTFDAQGIDDRVGNSIVGRAITRVEARGKNLLVFFDEGPVLHVHLRMLGRLRIFPSGTPVRGTPQFEMTVDGVVVRGSRIPVLRLLRPGTEARAPDLATLGPDLLAKDFDVSAASARLRALGRRSIGDALLTQRAVAGIGNVYKSEVLFLEHVDPRTPTSSLTDDQLDAILRRARTLLGRNLGSGPRRTRASLGGPRLWVYGRDEKPCLVCGTSIGAFRLGHSPGRVTYHCVRCQPPPSSEHR